MNDTNDKPMPATFAEFLAHPDVTRELELLLGAELEALRATTGKDMAINTLLARLAEAQVRRRMGGAR